MLHGGPWPEDAEASWPAQLCAKSRRPTAAEAASKPRRRARHSSHVRGLTVLLAAAACGLLLRPLQQERGVGAHHPVAAAFVQRWRELRQRERSRKGGPEREVKEDVQKEEVAAARRVRQHDGPLEVEFVELDVPSSASWHVAKVLLPMDPDVARWWTEARGAAEVSVSTERFLTTTPHVLLEVSVGDPPAVEEDGREDPPSPIRAIRAVVELPESAALEELRVIPVHVTADFAPLAGLGPIAALLLIFPVRGGQGVIQAKAGSVAYAVEILWRETFLRSRSPWRLLLLPWFALALPLAVGISIGPLAMLGGALLTLASVVLLSFNVAILLLLIQKRFTLCWRRWRRLWRLRVLKRRPRSVTAVFGETGPCCVCLGDANLREALIALLPCRHTLHDECYTSWVGADSYPSRELLCPLCRRKVEEIGKLAV